MKKTSAAIEKVACPVRRDLCVSALPLTGFDASGVAGFLARRNIKGSKALYVTSLEVVVRRREENTGENERRERVEGETAHPRLGVHPSLESVCAVITVSNRWDGAWEESVCV
ncbi:hypothetical protein Q5P01_008653 [Channa striata]|uniref:Uncharacterized protein n=1 Tax=Channa striata TaxID=64152 RepID=A0AA88N2Y4_CHASR|nr:hypothetical protein Q5P01_008653 [Channa striata]